MPSGIVEVLPVPVARRIEGLKGVQAEHVKLEHELKREMLELEKKVRTYLTSGESLSFANRRFIRGNST